MTTYPIDADGSAIAIEIPGAAGRMACFIGREALEAWRGEDDDPE